MIIDTFKNKEKILLAFLENAGLEGWNENCLIHGFNECQIDEKFLEIIFPNRIFSLIDFYIEYNNLKVKEHIIAKNDFEQLKINEKIKYIIIQHFKQENQHRVALQRLFNFFTNPKNFIKSGIGCKPIMLAFNSCYKIADNAWYLIGDKSIDFNFYSKRFILAKVILRCFFSFIKDDNNLAKTKNTLDNEINKILIFNRFKHHSLKQSKNLKHKIEGMILDDNLNLKSPKEIIKSLPFIRLFKL